MNNQGSGVRPPRLSVLVPTVKRSESLPCPVEQVTCHPHSTALPTCRHLEVLTTLGVESVGELISKVGGLGYSLCILPTNEHLESRRVNKKHTDQNIISNFKFSEKIFSSSVSVCRPYSVHRSFQSDTPLGLICFLYITILNKKAVKRFVFRSVLSFITSRSVIIVLIGRLTLNSVCCNIE